MTVEHFQLVPNATLEKQNLKGQILNKEITKENFGSLSSDDQLKVKDILFDISTENIDSNEGASTLEFILMAFIRLTNKKLNGESLNSEDVQIEKELNEILATHDLANGTARKEWPFNYMSYAQYKT